MRYVDCHAHFTSVPRAVKQWRNRQIAEFEQHGRQLSADDLDVPDEDLAQALSGGLLALQAERGIDLTLLSPIAGLMAHHYGDQETSVVWSRLSNDLIRRACGLFPDRLAGVCQLPQSPGASIDASVAELRRCVTELGFVGCNLNPDPSDGHWQAPPITDPYYYPLYAAMVELGVPAMVHASMSANPAVQGTCAHYLNADTTVFMQLCQSELFTEFPGLRLILPHGGGVVPYHWDRYQGVLYDEGRGELLDVLGDNVYFDTCVYGRRGMRLLVDAVPAKNLVFASELIGAVRGADPATGRRYDDTRSLLESLDLSEVDLTTIASGNAHKVFPRLAGKRNP